MPSLDPARIASNLASLRISKSSVFGADSHGFHLCPPLSDREVTEFELRHRITLPADYRQFICHVGNGGAGPFYGVFPLGRMDDNFDLQDWQEEDGLVGVLSEPFPLSEEWNDLTAMPDAEQADTDELEYEKQIEAFDQRYWSASLVNGAIPICHEGCAIRIWLVVSGPQSGNLWEDRRSELKGLMPLRLIDGSRATFETWYDEWMDTCQASK
jgi:hypothetical protein